MSNEEKYKPSKAGGGDLAHSALKGALSAIPFAGGPAAELLAFVLTPPLEKRRAEWMEQVAAGLRALESEEKIDLTQLQDNPAFVTSVMHATHVALRNHQTEKLNALRNAILNSTLPHAPEDSLQVMFIHLIDSFTEWHMRILYLFDDPIAWFKDRGDQFPSYSSAGLKHIIEAAFPELERRSEFYTLIWRDLESRGLITGDLTITISSTGLSASRTTGLGKAFLTFITKP